MNRPTTENIQCPIPLVKLHKGHSAASVNKEYEAFRKMSNFTNRLRICFYPLQKLYFDQQVVTYLDKRLVGNYTHVLILIAIAVLIMLVGLFNFINVYTVLIQKRAREFGYEKRYSEQIPGKWPIHCILKTYV